MKHLSTALEKYIKNICYLPHITPYKPVLQLLETKKCVCFKRGVKTDVDYLLSTSLKKSNYILLGDKVISSDALELFSAQGNCL